MSDSVSCLRLRWRLDRLESTALRFEQSIQVSCGADQPRGRSPLDWWIPRGSCCACKRCSYLASFRATGVSAAVARRPVGASGRGVLRTLLPTFGAAVAKLVNAADLGSASGHGLRVRVPPAAPLKFSGLPSQRSFGVVTQLRITLRNS